MGVIMKNSLNISNHDLKSLILVAEDNDISFRLLDFVLKASNYKVIRALNGKEAVDIFTKTPGINLVLTDLSMPEMDGIEATRHIREMDKDIPIVVQTGFSESAEINKAIEAGCNAYITKPIRKDELLLMIKEHLNGNSEYASCG